MPAKSVGLFSEAISHRNDNEITEKKKINTKLMMMLEILISLEDTN